MAYYIQESSSPQSDKIYTFSPEKDITPYEIALALPILVAAGKMAQDVYHCAAKITLPVYLNGTVEALPGEVRRHFKA